MSGGVDSTACALLVKKQYSATGYYMKLAQPDLAAQLQRVKDIASRLEIPLRIIDLQEQFQKKVLDYFSSSYFKGLTPNPCVICNKEIKFGLFMDSIIGDGNDLVATGHYACVESSDDGYSLAKGVDATKDQSYFLSRLTQDQLGRVIFPLGKMAKQEIYNYVERNGFTDFRGQESQDVCFLGDTKVGDYLNTRKTVENSGPIQSTDGTLLGTHRGLHLYTIGQRRGLGLPDATPWYVVGLNPEENCLIVGKQHELHRTTINVNQMHWISGHCPDLEQEYPVHIRYSHKGATARIKKLDHENFLLTFQEPQRAITPGQFAVIYHRNQVLGSGVIL